MTKRCHVCRESKSLEAFATNRSKPDGLNSMCRPCKKAYNAGYYMQTKQRHNPSRAERRKRHVEDINRHLIEYLQAHPCVDCGETDIVVLDFDHQRDKTMDVNRMKHFPWHRIVAEIEKCEVVCANDHRRRTAVTQGWARARAASPCPVS